MAIAEFCGWVLLGGCCDPDYPGWVQRGVPSQDGMKRIPDYLNDLNAIWEAEMKVAHSSYGGALFEVLVRRGFITSPHTLTTANLLALGAKVACGLRAEAVLRTVGKWVETPEPHPI